MSEISRQVSGKGSLDHTTTYNWSDPAPPRQAVASGPPRNFPALVLVSGRGGSALLSSHYKQDMTCDY